MDMIMKCGLLVMKDGKFLVNRKKNTKLFLLPGGKPKTGESPEECLAREIKEEHGCTIKPDTPGYVGQFEDKAANEPDTIIRIILYRGDIEGEPKPSSEIEEQRWFGKDDDPQILSLIIRNKILPLISLFLDGQSSCR